MKKIFTFITLCLFTAMSAMAAAGDVTTNANIDFSSGIADGVVTGTKNSMTVGTASGSGAAAYMDGAWFRQGDVTNVVTIAEGERAGARDVVNVSFKMAWGNKNNMGTTFKLKDADGNDICSFTHCRWGSSTNTLNVTGMGSLIGSHYGNKPIVDRYTTFEISIDYATKTITTKVSCQNPKASNTFTSTLTNTNPVATFELTGFGVGGNTDRADAFKDLLIQTVEGDYNVATANYSVKYVDSADAEIKTAVTDRVGDVGAAATVLGTDKEAIYVDGKKYVYASDDAADVTIAADNSAVVTVKFNEVAKYNYAIKAVDASKNALKTLAEGAAFTDEPVNMYIPLQVLSGGKLYGVGGENSYKSFTITEENQTENIEYKNVIDNVVAFIEGEQATGASESTPSGNQQLASGGHMGRGTNLPIATLEAGKYKVALHYINTNASAHDVTVNAGDTEVAKFSCTARPTLESEEFTLTEAVDLKFSVGGSSTSGVDYIYVIKTGDYVADNTITAGKYTVTATVTKVAETIPAAFEKYVGEYETNATIEGDEKSLVITENAEEGIFAGFEIVGDAVAFSADKKITLGGKQFTVRAMGSEAVEGKLKITADAEPGCYTMESADVYYNGIKAATVSNIKMVPYVAAAVADFEDITIDPATGLYQPEDEFDETCYWNSGDFTFSTYTDEWTEKYYYDFVGTNSTSSAYTGLADQYNSAAGGAKSGENYVVWYDNYYGSEGIYCPDAMQVSGFYVTNTAWVVDAITKGDGMSEESDGTKGKPFGYQNAEDKLTLVVTGYDEELEETGTVEYTLAEVKDGKIYYVKDWRWVDLTSLGDNVINVQFAINSTKGSEYGSTTPSYFCMDDFNGVAPEVDAEMAYVDVPTAVNRVVEKVAKENKAMKFMQRGKLMIKANGKTFNAAGMQMTK